MRFKKESITTSEAVFLDLLVIIENKKFKNELFDKRHSFPFSTVYSRLFPI